VRANKCSNSREYKGAEQVELQAHMDKSATQQVNSSRAKKRGELCKHLHGTASRLVT